MIKPLKDWVVLEVGEEKPTLELPDSVKTDYARINKFRIKDIASTYREYCELPEDVTFSIGDTVIFEGAHSVFDIELEGEKVIVAQARYIAFKEVGDGA